MNRLLEIIICALPLAFAACGSGGSSSTGGGSETSTVGGGVDPNDFIVGVGTGLLGLSPGESATVQVKLIRGDRIDDVVHLAVWNASTGIITSFEDDSLDGDTTDLHVLIDGDLEPGAYPLTVIGRHGSLMRTARLDVQIPGTAGFTLRAPPNVALRQDSQTTVPVTIEYAPRAKGPTQLGLSELPPGVTASFAAGLLEEAQTLLTLSANPNATPGTYSVDVRGTLDGQSYVSRMQVTIATNADAPDLFIAGLEFGQVVVRDTMTLVRGKEALLRVHVLADRILPSPIVSVTASANGAVLGAKDLTPPAWIGQSADLDDLGRSYRTTLPADWVVDGLHLRVVVDPPEAAADRERVNNQWERDVAVDRGAHLRLTLVPLRIGPHTATVIDFAPTVLAMLPMRDVTITVRPTYQPSSVEGSTIETEEWYALLSELRSLHGIEGGGEHFYGLVPTDANNSALGGLGYLGYPVAAGLDRYTSLLIHELGHNFDLQHVACGTTGDSNYPYSTSTIGTRGYNTLTNNLVPTWFRDVMSYCSPVWISDYHYEKVQSWVQTDTFAARLETAPRAVISVSGTIRDGQVALDPLLPMVGPPTANAGDYTLWITTTEGTHPYRFEPRFVSKCSERDARDHGHFQLLVPDLGDVYALAIEREGQLLHYQQRVFKATVKSRGERVDVAELDGELRVTWDDRRYPAISVAHVGARTRTLGLWLRGGKVSLDLTGVPPGGAFRVTLSSDFDSEMIEFVR